MKIYVWQSYVDYYLANLLLFKIPSAAGLLRRKHWQKKYSEVNPSLWTSGILGIDENYFRKEKTPDEFACKNEDTNKRS